MFAFAEGHLAAAYADGALSLEEAILSAYHMADARDASDLRSRLAKVISSPRRLTSRFRTDAANLTVDSLVEKLTMPENGHSKIPAGQLNIEIGGVASIAERGAQNESKDILLTFARVLGTMYMTGANPLISKLYPAVQYPMPSQTPSLSSLIKWKHDRSLPIAPFLLQSECSCQTGNDEAN